MKNTKNKLNDFRYKIYSRYKKYLTNLRYQLSNRSKTHKLDLNYFRYKIFSQFGEDGITVKIFDLIGTTNKICVEFGVESGKECCSKILWVENNFKQVLFDSSHKNLDINLKKETITVKNVLQILSKNHIPINLDFLCVDIDSYDFYVVHKILEKYYPRLLIVESHPVYGKEDKTVKLNNPLKGAYNGASLKAWVESLKDKYDFVCHEEEGINAFFVKKGLLKNSQIKDMNNFEKLYRVHPRLYNYPPFPKGNYPLVAHKDALLLLKKQK